VLTPLGWRAILAFSALASLWSFVLAAWVPESPYWLVGVNRKQDARAVLERLTCGRVSLPPAQVLTIERSAKGSTFDIFKGAALRITALQVAVNFAFSWGYWGLQTWMPTLLQQRGLSLPQSYGFIALSAVCMIPGYLAASWLTGRFGRKRVVIAFVAASAIAGYGFANATDLPGLYASNFLLAFFSLGAWGVWDTWIGELYPTRIRVIGYSWGVMAQRVANTLAPSVVGLLIARSSSFNLTATFIDAFLVVTALLAMFLPETEGRDLD
jgi:MFS transporter, putative metabolite:H+ symporter